jgi:ubiquinone/menaquinone biosynthesis C-methylase UbiE
MIGTSARKLEPFLDLVDRFERTALQQQAFEPEHYDSAYFAESWRGDGSRYDLETRRRVEAKHPELVRNVLRPTRALDVGCGPGFLMHFLSELGIDVQGVDFSPASLELAPPGIRGRIALAGVERLPADDQSFDLVLCREVLEHLTVLQIRRAVRELCRVSSGLVYVTTRFHPDPHSLLDVATDLDTDPTHITLLSKDFLRVLFVLEGFRRRAELEQQMDWAGKRRVLVYERAA